MRNQSFPVLILSTLLVAALPCIANEKHLLLGTWHVDVSKLDQPDPPASVTMVFAEAANGSFTLTFEIATRDGQKIHVGSGPSFKPGSLIPVADSAELDVAIFDLPNRRTLVLGAALANRPAHTRVWALSDDGTCMTETIVGHIGGTTPHIRKVIWRR
jgi:hypothetical protein